MVHTTSLATHEEHIRKNFHSIPSFPMPRRSMLNSSAWWSILIYSPPFNTHSINSAHMRTIILLCHFLISKSLSLKINGFMHLVHPPKFYITRKQRFENWIILHLQVRRPRHILCWVLKKELTSIIAQSKVKAKVKVILRPTVSPPVCLGVRHPSGTHDQFFFLLEIFFRQLRVCYFVPPSLMRGWICNLLLLLVLISVVLLGSVFRGTQDHILLSQFLRLPQLGDPSPRIYIPKEQCGPDIPLGTWFNAWLKSDIFRMTQNVYK
jgi:hypothetical protein